MFVGSVLGFRFSKHLYVKSAKFVDSRKWNGNNLIEFVNLVVLYSSKIIELNLNQQSTRRYRKKGKPQIGKVNEVGTQSYNTNSFCFFVRIL